MKLGISSFYFFFNGSIARSPDHSMVLTVCYLCFVCKLGGPKKAKLGFLPVAGILSAASALLFFGWLAKEMLEADTVQFDDAVGMAIHRFASPPLTGAMQEVSFLGSGALLTTLTLLVILLFLYFRWRRAATLLAIAMAGNVALEIILKDAFHRARPAAFFGTAPLSYSFPSGHAMGALCFYGALAALLSARISGRGSRWLIWMAALLLTGLIGFSRVYLGVHYPSDVLAGYSAALVWIGTIGILDKLLGSDVSVRPEPTVNASNLP